MYGNHDRRRWPGYRDRTSCGVGRAAPRTPSSPHEGAQALGYVLVGADGGVFNFGAASYAGSMAGQRLAAPVSAVAESLDANGYWLAGQDKGVFAFGDAGYHGPYHRCELPVFRAAQ